MKAPNVHGMKVKRPLRAKCRCMFMYYVLRYESTQCAWNESEKTFKVRGKRLAHCEVLQVQCFMNIIILSELMKTYMFVVNPG